MNEQFKKILEGLKNFWNSTSKTIKIALIAGLAAVVVVALVLSMMLNRVEYITIYDGLSASETSEILAALNEMNVSVKVENGDAILVPADKETEVRMHLATQGYPKSGLSYYLIEENSGMLTTDYERKQYETMQLQERLGASIETLAGVKQAIVTIAQSDDSIFYLTEKTEASASVVVHMQQGQSLTESQVIGIRNLVASAVPGLLAENVAMTDGKGNSLIDDDYTSSGDSKRVRLANEVESQIKKKVEYVLSAPYGDDHFKVSVTATVNTDNILREEMTYYPSPDGENSGVIKEETHASDTYESSDIDGGVPGTSTNADVTTYPTVDGQSSTTSESTSDNIKYDVSYVKTLLEKNGAYIDDLSVGIVIDKSAFEPGERENLIELVSYAAGVPQQSVTVQSFLFYEDPNANPTIVVEEFDQKILYIAIAGAILLIAIIVAAVLLSRKKKRELEEAAIAEAERLERERKEQEETEEPFENGHSLKKLSPIQDAMRQEIKEFALENPEIAAQLIKTWLRADEDR